MLKYPKCDCSAPIHNISEHLVSKGRQIVITNVCNLNCGGCGQLIGHFPKDKLWFISLDELDKTICILKKHPVSNPRNKPITIFGGEPTLHPKWNELIAMLKKHAPTEFWINTNGRLGHQRYQREGNLLYWVDLHPESQQFVQTLYAAADVISLPNDMAYWEKAQKDCVLWKGCQSSIYNGKAYFCENAGPMDLLFYDGKYGWEIDEKHPFVKSKEEIDEQAKNFCKRCGWCVTELVARQFSKDPSYISPLNSAEIKRHKFSLPVIEPVKTEIWKKRECIIDVADFMSSLSVGLYQINYRELPWQISNKINECKWSWTGVFRHEVKSESKQEAINQALIEGRVKYDWTIILDDRQIIPNAAFIVLMDWMRNEKTKNTPRLQMSIPVYEMALNDFDPNMKEPPISVVKSAIIAFHADSQETYDSGIFSRLGHRDVNEGAGVISLWHDKFTDIVGGVINLTVNCPSHLNQS